MILLGLVEQFLGLVDCILYHSVRSGVVWTARKVLKAPFPCKVIELLAVELWTVVACLFVGNPMHIKVTLHLVNHVSR